jgi:hypothetical protein
MTEAEKCEKCAARQIIETKNIAECRPSLNLQIAKAYLAGPDSSVTTRTLQNALDDCFAKPSGVDFGVYCTMAISEWEIENPERTFAKKRPLKIIALW